jgi:APA family basic amino acid/polyamine antiporter
MMRKIGGQTGANAVSIAAMISIFAALNGSILTGSRVPYAMAQDGLFFRPWRKCIRSSTRRNLHSGALCMVCRPRAFGRYEQLFTYVIFASWILYGMTTAAVLVLSRQTSGDAQPYRTFGYPLIPIVFVLSALGLVISTLFNSPRESILGLLLVSPGFRSTSIGLSGGVALRSRMAAVRYRVKCSNSNTYSLLFDWNYDKNL